MPVGTVPHSRKMWLEILTGEKDAAEQKFQIYHSKFEHPVRLELLTLADGSSSLDKVRALSDVLGYTLKNYPQTISSSQARKKAAKNTLEASIPDGISPWHKATSGAVFILALMVGLNRRLGAAKNEEVCYLS